MSSVSIVKCNGYDIEQVRKSVRQAVDNLGGMKTFVKPGEKVLIKVNLLMRRRPEMVTTTHPSVAQALAELVLECGGKPIIGDSPGGYNFYNRMVLKAVYDTCGMTEAAEKSGAELNYNTEMVDVPYPAGIITKTIKTIKPVLEVDKIISVPKIKTHMMTVYSGAVKNLFGIIPGGFKADYHLRFEDVMDFANLLVDICSFAKPTLTVMDAVVGMEGYGPTGGKPKKVGLIIAGQDPFNMDVVASHVIGLKPEEVPTIIRSIERGLTTGKLSDVKVVGERVEDILIKDYHIPTKKVAFNFYKWLLPKFISEPFEKSLKPKPKFNHDKCLKCAVCAKSCPPKAIEMVDGKPVVDLDKCIRCFCCHELCNYEAIDIKRPWFTKIILR